MAKLFIILAFSLVLISNCQALMPFPDLSDAPFAILPFPTLTSDCRSVITDMAECLPYLLDDSQPDDSCCSAIESVVTTDAGCICETMESDNLPLHVTKAMTLPTICGVALPCDVHVNPDPSPADAPAPEKLVPSLAPESDSPAKSPSEPSPKAGPSHAPNSQSPAPSKSSAISLAVHPHSISIVVLLISVFFVCFP